ncbi:hypothetical protein [Metabacillus sp. Hm71]|uniref:hypothetical protein n=1 Tax=Metabacillus sp. Hm71 TaxID=3450743 RepID=UPI003F41DFFE
MDNFRNAYNGTYTTRRKRDVDSKKYVEERQNGSKNKQSMSNKKSKETKGSSSNKNSSNPLILPRPSVGAQQIKSTKKKKKNLEHEYVDDFNEPKTSDKEELNELLVQRKERIAEKEKQFTLMLEESFSLQEESSSDSEQLSYHEDDFSVDFEEISTKKYESEGEFQSLEEEDSRRKNFGSIKEEYLLQYKGDGAKKKEISSAFEKCSLTDKEVSLLLNKDYTAKDEFLSSASLPLNRFDYLLDKFCLMLEDSSVEDDPAINEDKEAPSDNGLDNEVIIEEKSKEEYCKPKHELKCSPKISQLPIVKLPVLLAQVNTDINLFDSFELPLSIANITKIDWSLDSFDCHVLFPSTTVFLKGILIAEIQYVNKKQSKALQIVKIPIPWEKIAKTKWLYSPVLPSRSQSEYMFLSQHTGAESSHYEFCEDFADQIQHDLRSINLIWHDELVSFEETPKVFIQGRANLAIDILQPQYIDLNSSGADLKHKHIYKGCLF